MIGDNITATFKICTLKICAFWSNYIYLCNDISEYKLLGIAGDSLATIVLKGYSL